MKIEIGVTAQEIFHKPLGQKDVKPINLVTAQEIFHKPLGKWVK